MGWPSWPVVNGCPQLPTSAPLGANRRSWFDAVCLNTVTRTGHISTAFSERAYKRVDAADDVSCRPDFSIFMYPWMLLPGNKVPAWGDAYVVIQAFLDSLIWI